NDATTYRLFGLDYFDSVLLTGSYQAADIRFLEKLRGLPEKLLVTAGCSYLDVLSEKIRKLPAEENHPFTVLVSPSWGTSSLLTRYGEKLLDPLCSSGWRVIIRPHPQSKKSEAHMLERLQDRYKNSDNVEWDFESENIYSLHKADAMISDFSGIIFDFMFLCDKPVLYIKRGFDLRPYDADDLDHELWQFTILKEAGIELLESDFQSITELIKKASDNEFLSTARKKASETAWQFKGEAGRRIFNFMTGNE
ncbi:MAG: CDP-glycerol glycerophosphotransferase family protein, partial [Treponema sp.]|nr:CDP-glycerol glycerophosphotransferase family protein [Treponema sp.]